MVGVSASVNLPLHHKVQKFSSGTGSPGWSWKKGHRTFVVVVVVVVTQVGPRNHVLDGGPDPLWEGVIFGERGAHCKVWVQSAVSCAKTAERTEMPFALWVGHTQRTMY